MEENAPKKPIIDEEIPAEEPVEESPTEPAEEERSELEEDATDEQPEETEQPEPIPAGGMNLKQASKKAMQELGEALGKKAEATTSISREGENWKATVEVVDEVYLPDQKDVRSMNDMIGVYEISLSAQGELLNWTRINSRKRGDTK